MDEAIKVKWLRALRSGRYRQARGVLRRGKNNYCCLGVLCKIQKANFDFLRMECMPPHELCAGISNLTLTELTARNDGRNGHKRHNFKQIADFIEHNL